MDVEHQTAWLCLSLPTGERLESESWPSMRSQIKPSGSFRCPLGSDLNRYIISERSRCALGVFWKRIEDGFPPHSLVASASTCSCPIRGTPVYQRARVDQAGIWNTKPIGFELCLHYVSYSQSYFYTSQM